MLKNRMWSYIIISILLAIIFAGCAEESSNSINYLSYSDDQNLISIEYPDSWDFTEDMYNNSVIFYPIADASDSGSIQQVTFTISILRFNEFQEISLDKFTEDHIQNLSVLTDFIIKENNATTLSNLSAHELIFTYKEHPYDFMQHDLWTFHNNTIYLLSYSADSFRYSDYSDIILHMINSFKILIL